MYATVTVKWKIISYVDGHEWHEGMHHMCSCRHACNYSGMAYDLTRRYHYSKGCLMREQNIERWAGPGNKASVLSTCVCVCAVLGRNFYCVFHLYVYTTLVSYPARLFVVCFFYLLMNTLGMRLVPHQQIDMKKYTTASWCPHWNRKSLHRERACDIINKVGNSVYSAYFHIFFRHLENQWIGQL